MKLIVGLGNPGKKYKKTRHNLGFLAADMLAYSLQTTDHSKNAARWKIDNKFQSAVCRLPSAILIKPQTFVNSAGEAVKKIARYYKIKPEDILVIRDDIDLPEEKIRGPKNLTGAGGHKGIESIRKVLSSDKFYQLKIGVGRPPARVDATDWVLQKMSDKDWTIFAVLLKFEVMDRVKEWLNE